MTVKYIHLEKELLFVKKKKNDHAYVKNRMVVLGHCVTENSQPS